MFGSLLGPLVATVASIVSPVAPVVDPVVDVVGQVCPTAVNGVTLTGNLIGAAGTVEDVFAGDLGLIYADVFGIGGIIHNIANGGGVGTECLVP
jgi:hypothetical protein